MRLWNGGATIGALAFDPSGRWIAAGGNDGKVRIWDRNQSFTAPRVLDAQSADSKLQESINGIAFSKDGRWLAAAGEAHVIHLWDGQNGWRKVTPPVGALRHDGPIWGLCFDPLGRWLYSSNIDDNTRIRRWNIGQWTLKDETGPLPNAVWTLACSADGKRLISGDANGKVVVRETERLGPTAEMTNVKDGELTVWNVVVTESPVSILSGNSDGRVRRWIPADREWTGSTNNIEAKTSDKDARVNPTINSVSYSKKHGWIAAGGDGPSVEIYDRDFHHIRSLQGHYGTVWFVAFDPAGTRLAYGGTSRILRIFDLDEMDRDLLTSTPDELYRASIRATGLSVDDNKIVPAPVEDEKRGRPRS
jgi:WD40 repeat protein